jgi:hypothetical protein
MLYEKPLKTEPVVVPEVQAKPEPKPAPVDKTGWYKTDSDD